MLTCDTKSTHTVEVVPVKLEPHPNADRLSVVRVYGYTCCVDTEAWKSLDGKLAAYIPPDSLVDPSLPEFEFLLQDARGDGLARIRAKKLRGVVSFGLLVPAPEGSALGENVAEKLQVKHYEPPLKGVGGSAGIYLGGEDEQDPGVFAPKYDIEAFRRYAQEVFQPGEPVLVTEKIHGANAKYMFHDGKMYCGSRTSWKKEYPSFDHLSVEGLASQILNNHKQKEGKPNYKPLTEEEAHEKAKTLLESVLSKPKRKNLWWQALEKTPALEAFCRDHPGWVVYGEVYGAVQDLNYGHKPGDVSFAAFDLLQGTEWVNGITAKKQFNLYEVPQVPFLGKYEFDFDSLCEMAEGKTLIPGADHVREGVVIKPFVERWDERVGRVQLKLVGAGYLERKTS